MTNLDYEITAPTAEDPHWKWEVFKAENGATLRTGGAVSGEHAYSAAILAIRSIMAEERQPIRYDIIDTHTGAVVSTAKTRRGATRSVDQRDLAYGAVRFRAQPIYA